MKRLLAAAVVGAGALGVLGVGAAQATCVTQGGAEVCVNETDKSGYTLVTVETGDALVGVWGYSDGQRGGYWELDAEAVRLQQHAKDSNTATRATTPAVVVTQYGDGDGCAIYLGADESSELPCPDGATLPFVGLP